MGRCGKILGNQSKKMCPCHFQIGKKKWGNWWQTYWMLADIFMYQNPKECFWHGDNVSSRFVRYMNCLKQLRHKFARFTSAHVWENPQRMELQYTGARYPSACPFSLKDLGLLKPWHKQMQWFKPHVPYPIAIEQDLFQVSHPNHVKLVNILSKFQEISALYPH